MRRNFTEGFAACDIGSSTRDLHVVSAWLQHDERAA
jgi:hypothetical protein